MKFKFIFDVFSRRNKEIEPFVDKVPITLRNKILLYCMDVFKGERYVAFGGDYTQNFWDDIHKKLLYLHGRLKLTDRYTKSNAEDAINFLLNCDDDDEFLDFIEYIFKVDCLFHVNGEPNALVGELNELFASENIGYELTEQVNEAVVNPKNEGPFGGGTIIKTISYPQVIRKDNQVIYNEIIKPVLQFLSDPKYKTANQEYLEALEDYRRGDYGDCLTKSCSAFESTMKIICNSKKWPYNQTDTAGRLIDIIIPKTGLDSYFKETLEIIATLRDRLSKSHGAGTQPKTVSQNLARYALNSTASAIILLVNEAK